jgi:coproporphyrinogen III oxidase-like Fe-S oxidoreductase
MIVERLITYLARKENADSLNFVAGTALSVPRWDGTTPTLLYVHIPFCEELCPYCSFHRVPFREDLTRRYFSALRREILMYRDLGYRFRAVYVGGGTPTVLIDELFHTLKLIRESFPVQEVSVETNPNHLVEENLRILQEARVNRLSVGVQTFDDELLKAAQRYHKYGSGEEIVGRLQSAQDRFDTLNVDMIFNFPSQTLETLEKDLATLVGLGVDQVTYYPLMVADSTKELMGKRLGTVDYRRGKGLYEKIIAMLLPTYRPTTAWCFSKDQGLIDEYVVNFEEYAGSGSGSIGYLGGSAYANTFDIEEYIRNIECGTLPIAAKKLFSLRERLRYDFLMKLFGLSLDLADLDARHHVRTERYLWPEILFFSVAGGLKKEGRILSLTPEGQYYWVIMMREFFIGVNNFRDYCRREMEAPAGNR